MAYICCSTKEKNNKKDVLLSIDKDVAEGESNPWPSVYESDALANLSYPAYYL